MTRSIWWGAGTAALLLVCLGVGLLVAAAIAPTPIVGYVRFDNVIDNATAQSLADLLNTAKADPAVAAVVVEINSPGGYASSSENLFYTLIDLRRSKPVVAVVDGLAASGGYYMAVAANRIYAPASSYVGNVGTRGGRPVDPLIYPEELSSGPYKLSGGSHFDQIRQLDLVAQSFISNVVALRSDAVLNPLGVDAATVAEARIYLGSEAQAIGYIDAQGALSDGINGASELAGLSTYRTVDLAEYYGIDAPSDSSAMNADDGAAAAGLTLDARVQALVRRASPDTIYMMDDRVPLPAAAPDALIEQLRRLRATAAGTFTTGPAPAAGSAHSWPATALQGVAP